jgi:hypothetical protein
MSNEPVPTTTDAGIPVESGHDGSAMSVSLAGRCTLTSSTIAMGRPNGIVATRHRRE